MMLSATCQRQISLFVQFILAYGKKFLTVTLDSGPHLCNDASGCFGRYGAWLMCANEGLNAKGNTVGAEARFTVETFSAGRGDLDVTVVNPDGQQEKVRNRDCLTIIPKLLIVFRQLAIGGFVLRRELYTFRSSVVVYISHHHRHRHHNL